MDWIRGWLARWAEISRRSAAQRRWDEEIAFHLEMETRRNLEAGLSPQEARRRALITFGRIEQHRDTLREQRGVLLDDVVRDCAFAIRSLFRRPQVAVISVLAIAIAVGALTTVFAVVDGVLLRPLPYPHPDRLVSLRLGVNTGVQESISFSQGGFWDFHGRQRSYERLGAFVSTQLTMTSGGDPIRVAASGMSLDAFEAIGLKPLLGRIPVAEEQLQSSPTVALLSEEIWSSRFGGDTTLVGRSIDVSGAMLEVIGIVPSTFDFPSPATDLWYPLWMNPANQDVARHFLSVVGRLREGVSLTDAEAEAAALIGDFGEIGYDEAWTNQRFTGVAHIERLEESIVGNIRRPLLAILGAASIVLLIACGNVANLLLVRAETRGRDRAIRSAMGASRSRLVSGVLAEGAAVAILGGGSGLLLSGVATRVLVTAAPATIPRLEEIGIDATEVLFALFVTTAVALLVSALPLLRVRKAHSLDRLRDAPAYMGKGRNRARSSLIVVQLAMTVVLLVGSSMMIRTYQRITEVDAGFRPDNLLTFTITPSAGSYPTMELLAQLMDELLGRVESIPGVVSAGASNALPLTGGGPTLEMNVEGLILGPDEPEPIFEVRRTTPGYFATMGVPLLDGRDFETRDHAERRPFAIVSQSVGKEYWPTERALGKHVEASEVVGVVGDVRNESLTVPPVHTVYIPMTDPMMGGGSRSWSVVIRARTDPGSLVPTVRQELREIDPLMVVTQVRTYDQIISDSTTRVSLTAALLLLSSIVALLLASIGVFGVISYVTGQRVSELAVRQVLGASPSQLLVLVLAHAAALAAVGLLIGSVSAAWLSRSLATLTYGIEPIDTASFMIGAAVVVVSALAAAIVPAVRAFRLTPAQAMRHE